MRRILIVGYLGLAGMLILYWLLWEATHAPWLTTAGWLILFLGLPWSSLVEDVTLYGRLATTLLLWAGLSANFTLATLGLRGARRYLRGHAA